MSVCPTCRKKLLAGKCLNLECKSLRQKYPRRKSQSTSQPRKRNKKSFPDLSKPIPDRVNSSRYTNKSCISLLNYLNYSRAKDQTDEMRQHCLKQIIEAGPLLASSENKAYIQSFGAAGTRKRVNAIKSLLEWQVQGMGWVRDNPEKHRKKIPALEKAERDITWLSQLLDGLA